MNDTQNVLDRMTADIGSVKDNKAARLTPVGAEIAVLPNDIPGVFMSSEALAQTAKDLRKQATLLISVADGLDQMTGPVFGISDQPEGVPKEVLAHIQKAKEAAAEERIAKTAQFEAEFADKSAKAQAATFKSADADPDAVDWQCPTHGVDSITRLKSRKGREYWACTECEEFEK